MTQSFYRKDLLRFAEDVASELGFMYPESAVKLIELNSKFDERSTRDTIQSSLIDLKRKALGTRKRIQDAK